MDGKYALAQLTTNWLFLIKSGYFKKSPIADLSS